MHKVIRYTVRPEYAAENERLIQAVFAEVHELDPQGILYEAFVQDDGVSFVHVFTNVGDGPNAITSLAAFQRFQEGIADRCEVQPVAVRMRAVGSYGRGEAEPDAVVVGS
jgi:hypothetical protein